MITAISSTMIRNYFHDLVCIIHLSHVSLKFFILCYVMFCYVVVVLCWSEIINDLAISLKFRGLLWNFEDLSVVPRNSEVSWTYRNFSELLLNYKELSSSKLETCNIKFGFQEKKPWSRFKYLKMVVYFHYLSLFDLYYNHYVFIVVSTNKCSPIIN